MLTTRLFFVALCCALTAPLFAQMPAPCGYTGHSPWLEQYIKNRPPLPENNADTTWMYVPVTLHITGTDTGTGYYPLDQAIRALCEMNEKYEQVNIRFYLAPDEPVRYINNSSWHKHDNAGGREMAEANALQARLNAFVVSDPNGNCGYSGFGVIVLGQGCSGTGYTTWAHEAGHHFSLPHTFRGWEGYQHNYSTPAPIKIGSRFVENVDRTNCRDAGDFFCDTRPDYLNFRWTCNASGESSTLQTDPLGNTFRSDGTLLMGYADQACRARFTPEQIAAMRANLRGEHSEYLQWPEPGPGFPADAVVELTMPVDSQVVAYNNASFAWKPLPGAAFYQLEIARSESFATVLYRAVVFADTQYTFTKPIINNNTLYWRVKGFNTDVPCAPFDTFQTGIFRTRNLSVSAQDLSHKFASITVNNPVATGSEAWLSTDATESIEGTLELSDAMGRLVGSKTVFIPTGESQTAVGAANLRPGFYTLTLRTTSGTLTRRLLVQGE